MERPFFRNHWNYHPQSPRYVPSMMEIPVHRRTVPVAPKVVSIPVRFVELKRSRSDSATKIQKVFRGFLVRKSVKKVLAIEREVNEIERRLADQETVDLIRKDDKERVKFGEILMSLLFRLDSVKGVDSGIRNFRKAVIKKAIALQEKVDSVAAADEATDMVYETPETDTAECDFEAVNLSSEIDASGTRKSGVEVTPEIEDRIPEREVENYAADIANNESAVDRDDDKREIGSADCCNELENVDGVASMASAIEIERAIIEDSMPHSRESNVALEVSEADGLMELHVSEHCNNSSGKEELVETVAEAEAVLKVPEEVENDMVHKEIEAAGKYAAMSEAESQTDSSNNPPNSDNEIAEYGAVDEREGSRNEEDAVEEEDSRMKGREENEQSRDLLEKMMVDNKKMMEMMAQLFEKNEMQSRLLCSLSHRVEQLEKALVYEMLRKKKKRNSVDCSEKCPKTKKSGK